MDKIDKLFTNVNNLFVKLLILLCLFAHSCSIDNPNTHYLEHPNSNNKNLKNQRHRYNTYDTKYNNKQDIDNLQQKTQSHINLLQHYNFQYDFQTDHKIDNINDNQLITDQTDKLALFNLSQHSLPAIYSQSSIFSINSLEFINKDSHTSSNTINCIDLSSYFLSKGQYFNPNLFQQCDGLIVNAKDLSPSSYIFIPSSDLNSNLINIDQDYSINQYHHIKDISDEFSQFSNTHNFSTTAIFPPILASLGIAGSLKLAHHPVLSGAIIIASLGIISGYLFSVSNNIKNFISPLSSLSSSSNHQNHNPAVNKRRLSPSSSQLQTNNNDPNENPFPPIIPDLEQKTQHQGRSNPFIKRLDPSQTQNSTKNFDKFSKNILPNFHDDDFFASLENYPARLSNINGFYFKTIDYREIPITNQQRQLINTLTDYFYKNISRDDLDDIIYQIHDELTQTNSSFSHQFKDTYQTRYIRLKLLLSWIYLNHGVLKTILTLKLLTNHSIDADKLSKMFGVFESDINKNVYQSKVEIIKLFDKDFLHNIDDINILADYIILTFSLIPENKMVAQIRENFQFSFLKDDFYRAVLSFMRYYRLTSLQKIMFLTTIIKIYPLEQDFSTSNFHILQSEIPIMEEAFYEYLIAQRYKILKNSNPQLIDKIIDSLSNFESVIFSKIDASYNYQQGNTLTYQSNQNLLSRLNLAIESYYNEPDSIKYPKSILRKILFVQIFSSEKNHLFFRSLLEIDYDPYLKLKDSLRLHYINSGGYFRHLQPLNLRHVLAFDDEKILSMTNHLLHYSDENPLTDSDQIKMLISQFHNNKLSNDLERMIFINFVLRLRLVSINSIMLTIRNYYKYDPEIAIENYFDLETYHIDPPIKIIKIIDQTTKKFIKFIGEATESSL